MSAYQVQNLGLFVRHPSYLSLLAFLFWLLIQIDAIFPRLQMIVWEGQAPLPTATIKGLLLTVLLTALLVRYRLHIPNTLGLAVLSFATYLTLEVILLEPMLPGLSNKLYSYYNYYYFLLILPLAFTLRKTFFERLMIGTLVFIFIPLAFLSVAQHYLQQPLLSTQSVDNQFQVISWGYPGYVRGFSLFGSALGFGHYLGIIAPLSLILLLRQKRWKYRPMPFALLVLALWTTYATLTRLVFLWVISALLFALLFEIAKKGRRFLLYSPLFFGMVGVFVAIGLPGLISQFSDSPVLSDYTLQLRLDQWNTYLSLWLSDGDWYKLLFGVGYVQTSNPLLNSGVVIDNTYLAVAVHIGIIGLVFYLVLLWQIWKFCFQTAMVRNSPLTIAVASFVSAWMLAGIFNIELESFVLAMMLSVWSYTAIPLKKGNIPS